MAVMVLPLGKEQSVLPYGWGKLWFQDLVVINLPLFWSRQLRFYLLVKGSHKFTLWKGKSWFWSVRKWGVEGSWHYLKVWGGHGIVSRHGSEGRGWNPCRLASLSLLCLPSNSWSQSHWCLNTDNFKHSIIISNLGFSNLCDDFCSNCDNLQFMSLHEASVSISKHSLCSQNVQWLAE